jgi:tetratricopeptide (TPR) repeat protein
MTIGKPSVSVFIVFLLSTGTARAGQLHRQVEAADLQRQGDLIGAEQLLQEAVREARTAGPRSVKFAGALAVLGIFYQDVGRFSQAESFLARSLKILREINGPEDPALVPVVAHLAWLYVETGRDGPAGRLHLESWIDRLASTDPDSKYLSMLLETLGGLNALQNRFAEARNIYRRNFDLLARRGANLSMEMASAQNNFGFIQLRAGRHSEALINFSKALHLWTQLSGPNHLQTAISQLGLAETYMSLGQYDEAGRFLREALPIFERTCGPNSLRTEDVLTRYAQVLRLQKRRDEARTFEERARLIRESSAADLLFKRVIDVRDLGGGQP